jgi:hypothetical protein
MKKTYIITFSISVIVMFSVGVISLMLMLPQAVTVDSGTVKEYDGITKSEYTYNQTKDISKESLLKEYNVSNQDINTYEKKDQYNPGNSDPFTVSGASSSGTTGTTGTSTGTTDTTTTKITNSNGGVANPATTSK